MYSPRPYVSFCSLLFFQSFFFLLLFRLPPSIYNLLLEIIHPFFVHRPLWFTSCLALSTRSKGEFLFFFLSFSFFFCFFFVSISHQSRSPIILGALHLGDHDCRQFDHHSRNLSVSWRICFRDHPKIMHANDAFQI